MSDTAQQRHMRNHFQSMIDAYGLAVIGVGGDAEHDPFSYTLGMTAIDQPEIIVFGLPPTVAQVILNDIAMPIIHKSDDAIPVAPGLRRDLLANDVPVILIEADPERAREFVTAPGFFYGTDSTRVLQMVWPDAQGRWPWDEGTKATYTMLGDPAPQFTA